MGRMDSGGFDCSKSVEAEAIRVEGKLVKQRIQSPHDASWPSVDSPKCRSRYGRGQHSVLSSDVEESLVATLPRDLEVEEESAGYGSVFELRSLDEIYREIQNVYKADDRPWVIGFSGGKDSTTTLQLIWYAIEKLDPGERNKPIHVISTDTLVETPKIVDHIDASLDSINEFAQKTDLPFIAHKLKPKLDESFWVKLVGNGYPAPSQTFRWCTDRLKIRPADRFIEKKVSQQGEVVVVLGVRKAESATRKQVMELHKIKGSNLSRHSRFANAFVYTPIEDWLVDDVWTYLIQKKCPWGMNNRDLVAMYKEASDECPMVVDEKTPPCGNSRFGCWVCTLVQEDKAMQSMIDNGEEWMEPLLEFRDLLKETQDPEKKPIYREMKGSNGQIRLKTNGDGGVVPGPYKLEFCKDLLRRLLSIQEIVREESPDDGITLIRKDELHLIRRVWLTERGDWEDSVPRIYEEVTGESMDWPKDDFGTFGEVERRVVQELCEKQDIPEELIRKLLTTEIRHYGMKRRASIYKELDKVFSEDWRSIEEIVDEIDGETDPEQWTYDK